MRRGKMLYIIEEKPVRGNTMARKLRDDLQAGNSFPFLDRLFQNLFELMVANVLFVLCSIPLLTAGPAAVALERVCCLIHREEKVPVFKTFFQTFARYFGRGLFLSFVVLPLFFIAGIGVFLFYSEGLLGQMAVCMIMFLLGSGLLQYLAPLISTTDLTFEKQLKNGFLLLFLSIGRTLLGGVVSLCLALLILWQPKMMMALCFLILLAVHGYIRSYLALQAAQKYIFNPYYKETT